jgi:hypothetical protein
LERTIFGEGSGNCLDNVVETLETFASSVEISYLFAEREYPCCGVAVSIPHGRGDRFIQYDKSWLSSAFASIFDGGRMLHGSSAVIAPDGTVVTENLAPTEEGIIYAIVDHDLTALNKSFVDLIGNYSRPNLFTLAVDDRAKTHVVYHQGKGHPQINGEKVGRDKFRAGGVVKKVDGLID